MSGRDAFAKLCANLGQDTPLMAADEKALFDLAVRGLSASELRDANHYLSQLLIDSNQAGSLSQVWWSSPAQIHFKNDAELRLFLEKLEERTRSARG